jgi:hypothetical protein
LQRNVARAARLADPDTIANAKQVQQQLAMVEEEFVRRNFTTEVKSHHAGVVPLF